MYADFLPSGCASAGGYSGAEIAFAGGRPAVKQGLAPVRVVSAEIAGEAFGFAQKVGVQRQFGDAEHGFAGLSCAEQFTRAAYGKVFFGNAEAVGGFGPAFRRGFAARP